MCITGCTKQTDHLNSQHNFNFIDRVPDKEKEWSLSDLKDKLEAEDDPAEGGSKATKKESDMRLDEY